MKKYIIVKFRDSDRVLTDATWLEQEINIACTKASGNLIQIILMPVPMMIIEISC